MSFRSFRTAASDLVADDRESSSSSAEMGNTTATTRGDDQPPQPKQDERQAASSSAPPSPPPSGDEDSSSSYEVTFKRGDKSDPLQWSNLRKWQILIVVLLSQFWANVISAIYSPAASGVASDFSTSMTVARLPAAFYLYGLAAGPVFTAPLSEDYGRWPVHVVCLAGLGLMQIPCALTQSIVGLIIARFIAGVFAAATFNSIGMVSDMWEPEQQGWGVNSFAFAAETGASIAPVFAGYLFVNAGWRWVFGVCGIVTGFLLLLFLATVPETRAGVLLEKRAKQLRKQTGDSKWYTLHARAIQAHTTKSYLKESLVRPLFMLFTEPIVASFAAFDGYNYAILYLALEAIPLVYASYGFSTGQQGLPFIAILIGFGIGFLLFNFQKYLYRRAERRSENGSAPPEALLLWGVGLAVFFPISLFWFAWTSQPSIPWIVSVLSLVLFGISSHVIFMIVSEYTVRSYGDYSASAVAAQSFMREILSGSVTLVSEPMYQGLGYQWASCLLAFVALPLALLPAMFYLLGPKIRSRSPFAGEVARKEAKARGEKQEQSQEKQEA